MNNWVLTNVRVFDGGRLSEPTEVSVDGAVIRSIGDHASTEGRAVVNGAGATLLPG